MATVAELEAFQRAGVPDDLTDQVHAALRAAGGDSENPDDVEAALDTLTAPTVGLTAAQVDALKLHGAVAGSVPIEQAIQGQAAPGSTAGGGFNVVLEQLKQLNEFVEGKLGELEQKVADLTSRIQDRVAQMPQFSVPSQAAPPPAVDPTLVPPTVPAAPFSTSTASGSPTDPDADPADWSGAQ